MSDFYPGCTLFVPCFQPTKSPNLGFLFFREQHREEREASEKLRQLMEKKLKDMELQIKQERDSGGARAAELEEKLKNERSRADRMQKRKEKEAEMRSLMDQTLLKTIGGLILSVDQYFCFI